MTVLKAAVDVHYREQSATAACVLFERWPDAAASAELRVDIDGVAEYRPGQFYKRELPCLLAVLAEADPAPSIVLIDGHVWLEREGEPGLGAHLFAALEETTPVIGVAKSAFKQSSHARRVFRGQSRRPLYVTAIGIDPDVAAAHVESMAGAYRVPTLLKRVDSLARGRS